MITATGTPRHAATCASPKVLFELSLGDVVHPAGKYDMRMRAARASATAALRDDAPAGTSAASAVVATNASAAAIECHFKRRHR